ncbi:hypothetical protein CJF32_00006549 [Rutstroemia sp. NJR-2017a WRK4]|nr:hypothetical protein CJF32_00006549 [Rutstroemia sp. NJR-2017a WRK4]
MNSLPDFSLVSRTWLTRTHSNYYKHPHLVYHRTLCFCCRSLSTHTWTNIPQGTIDRKHSSQCPVLLHSKKPQSQQSEQSQHITSRQKCTKEFSRERGAHGNNVENKSASAGRVAPNALKWRDLRTQ